MPNDQDSNQNIESTSLRDTLEASVNAIETPAAPDNQANDAAAQRARDEQGRFAAQQAEQQPTAAPTAAPEQSAAQAAQDRRLTTWRKEYLPIQDKLARGEALTADEAKKLADYNHQRESEYSTGISTYKAEAVKAKEIMGAMGEFMPLLQQHGIQPTTWIQNLGRAHTTLSMGTPEQKLQMFAHLAQQYGIPLPAVQQAQQGQIDPVTAALMAEIQTLKNTVGRVSGSFEEQQQQRVFQELQKFTDAEQYPHFFQVKATMAQLLEAGLVQTPDEAYAKAVRMDDTAWQAEQERQASAQRATQAAASAAVAVKAQQRAASVRSTTPGVAGTSAAPATDRRAALAEAFDSADGGGRL